MRPSASVCAAASNASPRSLDDHARGLAALGVEHVRGDHEAEDHVVGPSAGSRLQNR